MEETYNYYYDVAYTATDEINCLLEIARFELAWNLENRSIG